MEIIFVNIKSFGTRSFLPYNINEIENRDEIVNIEQLSITSKWKILINRISCNAAQ